MLQSIMSLSVLLCVSSLFLMSEAQFFDTGAGSLAGAPVGFVSNFGAFGDEEEIASLGGAEVGTYHRQEYVPEPWYQVPIIPYVEEYQPIRPLCRLPGPCDARLPVVRPVKHACRLPGPCDIKPVVVRPPVKKHVCKLPGPCGGKTAKPVRPAVKPVIRPAKRQKVQSKGSKTEGRNSLISVLSPAVSVIG